eukprot:357492-Chlamydomonas_euryale.AAC.1
MSGCPGRNRMSGCPGRNRMCARCTSFLYLHSAVLQHMLSAGRKDMPEVVHDVTSRRDADSAACVCVSGAARVRSGAACVACWRTQIRV